MIDSSQSWDDTAFQKLGVAEFKFVPYWKETEAITVWASSGKSENFFFSALWVEAFYFAFRDAIWADLTALSISVAFSTVITSALSFR